MMIVFDSLLSEVHILPKSMYETQKLLRALIASIIGGRELAESLHGQRERKGWASCYTPSQAGWELLRGL